MDLPIVQVDGVFKGEGGGPLIKWNPLANQSSKDVWTTITDRGALVLVRGVLRHLNKSESPHFLMLPPIPMFWSIFTIYPFAFFVPSFQFLSSQVTRFPILYDVYTLHLYDIRLLSICTGLFRIILDAHQKRFWKVSPFFAGVPWAHAPPS